MIGSFHTITSKLHVRIAPIVTLCPQFFSTKWSQNSVEKQLCAQLLNMSFFIAFPKIVEMKRQKDFVTTLDVLPPIHIFGLLLLSWLQVQILCCRHYPRLPLQLIFLKKFRVEKRKNNNEMPTYSNMSVYRLRS